MKIILLIAFVSGAAGFLFWQVNTDNENNGLAFEAAKQPIATQNNPTKASKNVVKKKSTKGLVQTVKLAALTKDITQTSVQEVIDANKTANEPDPESFAVDFVNSAKPEAIMDHFAELRRARADLIENQISGENSDPEWTQDLVQNFEAAEKLVPMMSGLNLAEADCRETICALHFDFDEGTSYKDVEPAMSNMGIVLGTDVWVHHDAGPSEPIVYVARANTVLPDLE